jgi:hypothetical protein
VQEFFVGYWILCQPPPGVLLDKPSIIVNGQKLKTTKTFPYLGSTISDDAHLDHEIERRIAKAPLLEDSKIVYGRVMISN